MQYGVRRAAQRDDDGDRIFESLSRHDVEWLDVLANQMQHCFARAMAIDYFIAGNRFLSRAVPQAHAQCLDRRCHGICGVHAATGSWSRYGSLFDIK